MYGHQWTKKKEKKVHFVMWLLLFMCGSGILHTCCCCWLPQYFVVFFFVNHSFIPRIWKFADFFLFLFYMFDFFPLLYPHNRVSVYSFYVGAAVVHARTFICWFQQHIVTVASLMLYFFFFAASKSDQKLFQFCVTIEGSNKKQKRGI